MYSEFGKVHLGLANLYRDLGDKQDAKVHYEASKVRLQEFLDLFEQTEKKVSRQQKIDLTYNRFTQLLEESKTIENLMLEARYNC